MFMATESIEQNKLSNISKYGEALKELIKKVFTSKNVVYEPVDTAFDFAFKQSGGNLGFPMISIFHNPTFTINKSFNSFGSYKTGSRFQSELPLYEEGTMKPIGKSNKLSKNVKNLYIKIGYQLDVWATDRLTAEQVAQELLFWLYDNQEVSIKYQDVEYSFSFDIGDSLIDNSDLVQYKSKGALYRYTLNIMTEATLLQSKNFFNYITPVMDVGVMEEE